MSVAEHLKLWMPALIGVGVSLSSVATVILALRFYTYHFVVRHKGGDGLLWAIFAWIFGVLTMVIYYLLAPLAEKLSRATWALQYIVFFPNQLSITFTKLGMVCYILDIQGHLYKSGKWFLLIIIGLCFMCIIITLPMTYMDHIYALANPKDMHNPNFSAAMFAWSMWSGGLYAFTDLVLIIYPIFMTWDLRISPRLKVVICILMGLGAIGTCVNLTNLILSVKISLQDAYGLSLLLNVVEMWLVFIAASAAPLWPLLTSSGRQWYSKFRASLAWFKLSGNKKSGDERLNEN